MGIVGLKPYLRPMLQATPVSALAGRVCAVDISGWLHAACIVNAEQLFADNESSTFVIDFCLKRLEAMESLGLRPFVVFDGARLPAKMETHAKRAAAQDAVRAKALANLKASPKDPVLAKKLAQASVAVSFHIVSNLMKALRNVGTQFIVAPYEADAQIAYLCAQGLASVVMTDDTDMVIHGCPLIMFDTNLEADQCLLFDASNMESFIGMGDKSAAALRLSCLAAGSDYHPSGIVGFGVKKSMSEIHNLGFNVELALQKMVAKAVAGKRNTSTAEVITANIAKADFVFHHQTVWSLSTQKQGQGTPPSAIVSATGLCHASPVVNPASCAENVALCGAWTPEMTAMPLSYSRGILCPRTGAIAIVRDMCMMPLDECLFFLKANLVPEVWSSISKSSPKTSQALYLDHFFVLEQEASWAAPKSVLSLGDVGRIRMWYRDFEFAHQKTDGFVAFSKRTIHDSIARSIEHPVPVNLELEAFTTTEASDDSYDDEMQEKLMLDMVDMVEADRRSKKRAAEDPCLLSSSSSGATTRRPKLVDASDE